MAFIIGKKMGMTRVFADDGMVTPVTHIYAEPMKAVLAKTKEKDGYIAMQFEYKTGKKARKKEFPSGSEAVAIGDQVDIAKFKVGDVVKVSGISKAKGFQGAVKRHGFHGMPASHGHHHVLRHVGSIGQRFPQHTLKGMRMAGRMGGVAKTIRGLKIIAVDLEKNILTVKGAVPGKRGGLLSIITI